MIFRNPVPFPELGKQEDTVHPRIRNGCSRQDNDTIKLGAIFSHCPPDQINRYLFYELISSSVKHGGGEIRLKFAVSENHAWLEMTDEGPGFPVGFDVAVNAYSGRDLIESAARWDLQGQVTYSNRNEGGARIVIQFPLPRFGTMLE